MRQAEPGDPRLPIRQDDAMKTEGVNASLDRRRKRRGDGYNKRVKNFKNKK